MLVSLLLVRYDWEKACTFYNDNLLSMAWNGLVGHCVALRRDRYRLEYRLTGVATAHYRWGGREGGRIGVSYCYVCRSLMNV